MSVTPFAFSTASIYTSLFLLSLSSISPGISIARDVFSLCMNIFEASVYSYIITALPLIPPLSHCTLGPIRSIILKINLERSPSASLPPRITEQPSSIAIILLFTQSLSLYHSFLSKSPSFPMIPCISNHCYYLFSGAQLPGSSQRSPPVISPQRNILADPTHILITHPSLYLPGFMQIYLFVYGYLSFT